MSGTLGNPEEAVSGQKYVSLSHAYCGLSTDSKSFFKSLLHNHTHLCELKCRIIDTSEYLEGSIATATTLLNPNTPFLSHPACSKTRVNMSDTRCS